MKKILFTLVIIALVSCESKEHKMNRISNDRNVYLTGDGKIAIIHLDAKCKYISSAKFYKPILKKDTDNYQACPFCPKCTSIEDIETLKSQIKNGY